MCVDKITVCARCNHIRINPEQDKYCSITRKKIEDPDQETCKNWKIMDYAF